MVGISEVLLGLVIEIPATSARDAHLSTDIIEEAVTDWFAGFFRSLDPIVCFPQPFVSTNRILWKCLGRIRPNTSSQVSTSDA